MFFVDKLETKIVQTFFSVLVFFCFSLSLFAPVLPSLPTFAQEKAQEKTPDFFSVKQIPIFPTEEKKVQISYANIGDSPEAKGELKIVLGAQIEVLGDSLRDQFGKNGEKCVSGKNGVLETQEGKKTVISYTPRSSEADKETCGGQKGGGQVDLPLAENINTAKEKLGVENSGVFSFRVKIKNSETKTKPEDLQIRASLILDNKQANQALIQFNLQKFQLNENELQINHKELMLGEELSIQTGFLKLKQGNFNSQTNSQTSSQIECLWEIERQDFTLLKVTKKANGNFCFLNSQDLQNSFSEEGDFLSVGSFLVRAQVLSNGEKINLKPLSFKIWQPQALETKVDLQLAKNSTNQAKTKILLQNNNSYSVRNFQTTLNFSGNIQIDCPSLRFGAANGRDYTFWPSLLKVQAEVAGVENSGTLNETLSQKVQCQCSPDGKSIILNITQMEPSELLPIEFSLAIFDRTEPIEFSYIGSLGGAQFREKKQLLANSPNNAQTIFSSFYASMLLILIGLNLLLYLCFLPNNPK